MSELENSAPRRPLALKDRRGEVVSYLLRIHVVGAKPQVWRRVFVPSDLTLARLHTVLQAAMGWEGRYGHHFQVEPFSDPAAVVVRTADAPGDPSVPDEAALRVDEVLGEPGDRLHYLYDPGDGWRHVIRLENVFPAYPSLGNRPVCIEGRGRCPVEGVGGVAVWNRVVAVLAGRAPAGTVEPALLRWAGQSRTPSGFDRRQANHRIREWLVVPPPPAPPRGDAPLGRRANRPWVPRPAKGMVPFPCVLDGQVAGLAGTVGVRRGLVVDTPWGAGEFPDPSQAVADGLEVHDAGFLHFLDPAFAPFWCPRCEAVYCDDHWRTWVVAGSEGEPDHTWGSCPRGHERLLR